MAATYKYVKLIGKAMRKIDFKNWLIFVESKEEKDLALKLVGDDKILDQIKAVIPQNQKMSDPNLLLASYYYSVDTGKNINQLLRDFESYMRHVGRNKMPVSTDKAIRVDLKTGKPPAPWDNYLYWTSAVHGHDASEKREAQKSFRPSQEDLQKEMPIMSSSDGKIRVYKSNSPQQCIILGKGQSFCISQPGNTMWKSYRDTQGSTFYFVYDDTRDDDLSIVVVDMMRHGVLLTDKKNTTGTTQDPFTGERKEGHEAYFKYLKSHGIDLSKFVHTPKTKEEAEEEKLLGLENEDLQWFINLNPDQKSAYIGRGHNLTDQQFDYLWNNKLFDLLEQYVKTGRSLNQRQVEKIATKKDLIQNYLHNRLIAEKDNLDIKPYEYKVMNNQQKQSFFDAQGFSDKDDDPYHRADKAELLIKMGDEERLVGSSSLKDLPEEVYPRLFLEAVRSNNLNIIDHTYSMIRGLSKQDGDKSGFVSQNEMKNIQKYIYTMLAAFEEACTKGLFDVFKYLMNKLEADAPDKFAEFKTNGAFSNLYENSVNNLKIFKYLIDMGVKPITGLAYLIDRDKDFVYYVIDQKKKENQDLKKDKDNYEAMFNAMTMLDQPDYIITLLKKGLPLNLASMDHLSNSFLYESMRKNSLKILQAIANDPDINVKGVRIPSNLFAIDQGLFKKLIDKGADIQFKNVISDLVHLYKYGVETIKSYLKVLNITTFLDQSLYTDKAYDYDTSLINLLSAVIRSKNIPLLKFYLEDMGLGQKLRYLFYGDVYDLILQEIMTYKNNMLPVIKYFVEDLGKKIKPEYVDAIIQSAKNYGLLDLARYLEIYKQQNP